MPYKDKQKRMEYHKNYREKNREKKRAYQKEYSKTFQGKKTNRISMWKRRGIICDYDAVYDVYVKETNCWWCNKEFVSSADRNLDHDHDITDGENIRGILCNYCNYLDVYKIN